MFLFGNGKGKKEGNKYVGGVCLSKWEPEVAQVEEKDKSQSAKRQNRLVLKP